ncbi:hypothetical protein FACS1894216_10850 [Synergistales bacterium]|nr:hypothetical protein FACS1894216_10850 [Synergistales bacterium]
MKFDCGWIIEVRQQGAIGKKEFAEMCKISEGYLSMIEGGQRQPGLPLMKRLSEITGTPLEKLLGNEPVSNGATVSNEVLTTADLKGKLECERYDRRQVDQRNLELERTVEHLTAVIGLHVQFEDIICLPSLAKSERMKKVEELARARAHDEFTFSEMQVVFRADRSVLKQWLDVGKRAYKCRFSEDKIVTAATRGEAAMRLRCFECAELESGGCRGYGNEKSPENFILLLIRLAVNGVFRRSEQSECLEESYGMKLSEHEISEIVHKNGKGLHVPEAVFNMDINEAD